MNLNGVRMHVSATAEHGVVGSDTVLHFVQKGSRVFGKYAGGAIERGCLVGTLSGAELVFRYVQLETSREVHAGRSVCAVSYAAQGRLRIVEHFEWSTREGAGTNVFDQLE
jgi:hypothetical protein